ncbi:MAG: dihydrofolate reductase [Firmicutes bacterium]|nr:dihydrofolate reductase [Bacillota bacterium]
MNLVIIACIGKNNELGCNNDLIWKFREDLQTFKKLTMGHQIVMGLNTYKSLPGLLPGREHLVIADQPFDYPSEIKVFSSLESFLTYARTYYSETGKHICVIGGGMIYKQLLPHSDKLILTEVDAISDATIFFPNFTHQDFIIEKEEDFIDSTTGIKYKRKTYIRNKFSI